jgi:hypothetical protein
VGPALAEKAKKPGWGCWMKRVVGLILKRKNIPYFLAALGVLLYFGLSVHYAMTQRSTIDEGLYLYKGYQFAIGKYAPYQDYGLRTQYGPLAYLIPGWAQLLFGPGLRTGRTLAVLSGLLALMGLWLVARRLKGDWWAVAAVWLAALNPGTIRTYSFGIVQGTVICLLMWMLFFSLERKNNIWQVSIGAVLAGLLLLTRQNMAPALPILVIYIFWQYGKKTGWTATAAGVITIIAGHLPFWPGIMKAWVPWLPAQLTPFLNSLRIPAGTIPLLNTPPDISARIYGLLEGLRFHFISVTGFLASLIFWPKKAAWKTVSHFRSAIFLTGLFAVLFILHLWAGVGFSEGNGYNTSTFSTYLSFFDYVGILIFILIFPTMEKRAAPFRQIAAALVVMVFAFGIGYGGFDVFGNTLANLGIPRLKTFISTGHISNVKIPLWDFLSTKYGLSILDVKLLVSGVVGLLAGAIILLAGFGLWYWFKRKRLEIYSYGFMVLASFLIIGAILTPTPVLGGGFTQWDCTGNVITDYEKVGSFLAQSLPAGRRLYWDGGNAVAILLYAPNIIIYPQQVDNFWNYYLGGDEEVLARLNSWNDTLATQWRDNSDAILFQQDEYPVWESYVNTPQFDGLSDPQKFPLNCAPDTFLRIFLR